MPRTTSTRLKRKVQRRQGLSRKLNQRPARNYRFDHKNHVRHEVVYKPYFPYPERRPRWKFRNFSPPS